MGTVSVGSRREAARALDVAVALEITGFRWVTWNERALGGAPLGWPGRFLAHPDDLMAHMHLPSGTDVRLAEDSTSRVPGYSSNADDAFHAADVAGLFTAGGARLEQSGSGSWTVEIPALGRTITEKDLPVALCRSALEWVRSRPVS